MTDTRPKRHRPVTTIRLVVEMNGAQQEFVTNALLAAAIQTWEAATAEDMNDSPDTYWRDRVGAAESVLAQFPELLNTYYDILAQRGDEEEPK